MCIAVYKPAGKVINKETLRECFNSNKDGCGFAYINEDYTGVRRIMVKKTMEFEIFWRQYERAIRINSKSPFLIHFRIATHGTVNKFNCHPFMVDNEHVFIHNGVIPKVSKDTIKSDTQMFNEEILQQLHPDDIMENPATHKLVESFLSTNNKVVVMNIDGDVQIFNENLGNWTEGVWYSNYSWKPAPVYAGSYGGRNYNGGTAWQGRNYGGEKTSQNSSSGKKSETPKALPNASSQATKSFRTPRGKDNDISIFDFIACDDCSNQVQVSKMSTYRVGDEIMGFCPDCVKEVVESFALSEHDKVLPAHFVRHFNENNTDKTLH